MTTARDAFNATLTIKDVKMPTEKFFIVENGKLHAFCTKSEAEYYNREHMNYRGIILTRKQAKQSGIINF